MNLSRELILFVLKEHDVKKNPLEFVRIPNNIPYKWDMTTFIYFTACL